ASYMRSVHDVSWFVNSFVKSHWREEITTYHSGFVAVDVRLMQLSRILGTVPFAIIGGFMMRGDDTLEFKTAFAEFLQLWMWEHRPPLRVGQLAIRTGIHAQTIHSWFNNGSIPNPRTLSSLARGTGIPLRRLYEVCGYAWAEPRLP